MTVANDFVLRRGTTVFINTDAVVPGGDRETDAEFQWGRADDQAFLGDVDGDGRDDFILRRGTTVFINTDAVVPGGDRETDAEFQWGRADDQAFLGDVDGDGRDDFILRRGTTFFINTDAVVPGGDRETDAEFQWGRADDQALLGDVDGDGRDTSSCGAAPPSLSTPTPLCPAATGRPTPSSSGAGRTTRRSSATWTVTVATTSSCGAAPPSLSTPTPLCPAATGRPTPSSSGAGRTTSSSRFPNLGHDRCPREGFTERPFCVENAVADRTGARAGRDPRKLPSRNAEVVPIGPSRVADSLTVWTESYQALAVRGVRSEEVATKVELHLGRFVAFFVDSYGDDPEPPPAP